MFNVIVGLDEHRAGCGRIALATNVLSQDRKMAHDAQTERAAVAISGGDRRARAHHSSVPA
jgi:hypothetical protein